MYKTVSKYLFFLSLVGLLLLGDTKVPDILLLYPTAADSVAYDQGVTMLVSVAKSSADSLLVSTQWELERPIDISTKAAREGFAKEFFRLFGTSTTIERFEYSYRYASGFTKAETLDYAYRDTMSVRTLWKKPEFNALVQTIVKSEALQILVHLRGWKDSIRTTSYDDPGMDNRSLYKIHVQLIHGMNTIVIAPNGDRSRSSQWNTTFGTESKLLDGRSNLFHNSVLEQNCITCHEGLPGADSGATMKADCAVCHKALQLAQFVHAPVEMKECVSCHSWSGGSKSFVFEKGVPGVCYDCHTEKRAAVDSSSTQHPVASDCLGCHSPHGTDNKHQLKVDVYTLCTGCHDKYSLNHPVGKHPVRFAKVEANGEEISCVSCHNPHGTNTRALLKVPGGRMAICLECHQK